MRTTVTLDDDVAAKLKDEIARTGSTFKEAINRLLRASLNSSPKPPKRKRFVVRPGSSGVKNAVYDKVWDLIIEEEGPLAR